jgi:hypothetical protein
MVRFVWRSVYFDQGGGYNHHKVEPTFGNGCSLALLLLIQVRFGTESIPIKTQPLWNLQCAIILIGAFIIYVLKRVLLVLQSFWRPLGCSPIDSKTKYNRFRTVSWYSNRWVMIISWSTFYSVSKLSPVSQMREVSVLFMSVSCRFPLVAPLCLCFLWFEHRTLSHTSGEMFPQCSLPSLKKMRGI